ncbi:hypothetical protein GNE08_26840 (plasmid) [Trichormus variabilis ARAD]|uniref:Uncharacterized protein n=1 Tax=Trichormus variabilis N2B TaxID=2681315 RepID=A0ABR6SGU3_ANAVA|nr:MULTISPECIES: hypothetical protein [Nostocaceae]MBC1217817.1 hypothetical protein [Trichormus variabilis ARAD]MBC1259033.1 hypothetical protein [Trichormus variabilis V5]MBC1305605.1 hypothetical protein [Trichormus variabilis N2B]MBC1314513.1 hypothetical protein [Trichormus variabilis PNB]MBC1329883.1 hypothetical protein [Trichormus variabilis 9RC]
MNITDLSTNISSGQALIIDEVASIKQHLQGHPQREEILRNIREYEAQILRQEQDKK